MVSTMKHKDQAQARYDRFRVSTFTLGVDRAEARVRQVGKPSEK